MQVWAPHYQIYIKLLETEQMWATKMVKSLERKMQEEQLKLLALFSLEETEEKPHRGLQLPHKALIFLW